MTYSPSSAALALMAFALSQTALSAQEADKARPAPEQRLSIALNTESVLVQQNVEYAMQSLLLGDVVAAKRDFEQALKIEPQQPIALCGMILCASNAAEVTRYANYLSQIDDDYVPTPPEGRYLDGLVMLITQQERRAQAHFSQLSSRYQSDLLSRIWAALLSQDGYDELGKPRLGQLKAQDILSTPLADKNLKAHGLLHYMLAFIEADAPKHSDEALEHARKAVELLPYEAMPQLLLAHHLARAMSAEGVESAEVEELRAEALSLLEKAEKQFMLSHLDEEKRQLDTDAVKGFFWLRLRLYRIALLLESDPKSALDLYREVESLMPLSLQTARTERHEYQSASQPSGHDLLLWEWGIIPLRQLSLSKRELTQKAIDLLVNRAKSHPLQRGNPLYMRALNCIQMCLYARLSQQKGQSSLAAEQLKEAQEHYKQLRQDIALDEQNRRHPLVIRALSSCDIFLATAQLAVYQDTAEIWDTRLKELDIRSSLLLPPLRH